MRLVTALLTATVLVFGTATHAQQNEPYRAARLSFVQGQVSVDGDSDTLPGQMNMPLVEGQRVTTGDDGEAEIEFEDGSMVRLTPESSAVLTRMSSDGAQHTLTEVGLLNGQFYLDLRASEFSQYTVDAAGERITPSENSVVRVRMDNPPAEIGVMQGLISIARDGGFNAQVRAGESLRGDADDTARYFLTQTVAEDSWDNWNEEREQEAQNEANMRTDAQQSASGGAGYGWSDLDAYGDWYNLPGEGQVWQPEVATDASFDPYGYGSWTYYPGAGYVWVSSYPWGWTPFRCGNWNYWQGFGWGWQSIGCNTWGGGWGGYGGVYVRINRPPVGYRGPVRPFPGPRGPGHAIPPHKVIPITTGRPAQPVRLANHEGRPAVFNHKTVQPLQRRPGYTTRGGSAVGSGLKRDYPVDTHTSQPVMGVSPSQPAVVQPGSGWRAVGGRGGAAAPVQNQIQNPVQNDDRTHHGTNPGAQQGGQPGLVPSQPLQHPGVARPIVREPESGRPQPSNNRNEQPQGPRPSQGNQARPTSQQPTAPVPQQERPVPSRPTPQVPRPEPQRPAPQVQQPRPQVQQPRPQMQQPRPMPPMQQPRPSPPPQFSRPSAPPAARPAPAK